MRGEDEEAPIEELGKGWWLSRRFKRSGAVSCSWERVRDGILLARQVLGGETSGRHGWMKLTVSWFIGSLVHGIWS